jgi:predicted alpha/beta-hydrolase family hydrolase
MQPLVILSHGQESGPDATKVTRLAAIAESRGCRAERPDYRGIHSPIERRAKLVERIRAEPGKVILVGSSMGSFISGLASIEAPVAGLFLLALPLSVGEEWPVYAQAAVPCELVHGWHDELIPAQDVVDFAAQRSLALHLVDDEHRLGTSVDRIECWFGDFLDRTLS